jgi:hypothetical protein
MDTAVHVQGQVRATKLTVGMCVRIPSWSAGPGGQRDIRITDLGRGIVAWKLVRYVDGVDLDTGEKVKTTVAEGDSLPAWR